MHWEVEILGLFPTNERTNEQIQQTHQPPPLHQERRLSPTIIDSGGKSDGILLQV